MKKKIVSAVIACAMFVSASASFASVGRINPADNGISQNRVLNISGEKNYTAMQTQIISKAIKSMDEIYGTTISFQVKANSENPEGSFGYLVLDISEGETKLSTNPFFLSNQGYMGSPNPTSWAPNLSTGYKYEKGKYYTVGMAINDDNTFDLYINGEHQGNIRFGKEYSKNPDNIKLYFNNEGGGSHTIKDFIWCKTNDNGFVAESAKNIAVSGGSVSVEFSELIGAVDTSAIKLYNCATGEEVTGISCDYSGMNLTVTLPAELEQGEEYRIELDGVKSATGRKLYNDNVYFNCQPDAAGVTTNVAYETFECFDGSITPKNYGENAYNNYRVPEGWYIKKAENPGNARYVYPETTDKGTSVKIGTTGLWNGAGMYLPLGDTITGGTVSISYDIKPLYYAKDAYGRNTAQNIMLEVYPEGADTNINYNLPGRDVNSGARAEFNKIGREIQFGCSSPAYAVSGVRAGVLGRPKNDILANFDTFKNDNNWEVIKAFKTEEDLNEAWYNVRVEMDFDSSTMTWYLDGVKCAEDTSLMTTLGITSIGGLGFYKDSYTGKSLSLIDNVIVTHTLGKELSTEEPIFEDNFNAFENTVGNSQTTSTKYTSPSGIVNEGTRIPNGWVNQPINNIASVTGGAKAGKDGNGFAFGKMVIDPGTGVNPQWDAMWAYHRLDKEYTSGIINVSYDVKANALTVPNDPDVAARAAELGINTSGWGLDGVQRAFEFAVDPGYYDTTDWSSASISQGNAKRVFGIQNKKFAAFVNNSSDAFNLKRVPHIYNANYRNSVEIEKWYSVSHSIDLDNKTVSTYVDDELVSVASTQALGITSIGGICFGGNQSAIGTEVVIDNVRVTGQAYQTNVGGVMQVRFSDYYNDNYGAATSLTTVADTVAVAFWAKTVDTENLSAANFELINTKTGASVGFDGQYVDAENVYIMNLREYLDKASEYKLTVSGLTSGGADIKPYEQLIRTDAEGVIIEEPMYFMINAESATEGALSDGDTITAGTRIINTTGEKKSYAFGFGLYELGNRLNKFDFREVTLDGVSQNGKEANISCSFTMSADDAAKIKNAKAFLWNGMAEMTPVLPSAGFTNTAE